MSGASALLSAYEKSHHETVMAKFNFTANFARLRLSAFFVLVCRQTLLCDRDVKTDFLSVTKNVERDDGTLAHISILSISAIDTATFEGMAYPMFSTPSTRIHS